MFGWGGLSTVQKKIHSCLRPTTTKKSNHPLFYDWHPVKTYIGWVKHTAKQAALPPNAIDWNRDGFLPSDVAMVNLYLFILLFDDDAWEYVGLFVFFSSPTNIWERASGCSVLSWNFGGSSSQRRRIFEFSTVSFWTPIRRSIYAQISTGNSGIAEEGSIPSARDKIFLIGRLILSRNRKGRGCFCERISIRVSLVERGDQFILFSTFVMLGVCALPQLVITNYKQAVWEVMIVLFTGRDFSSSFYACFYEMFPHFRWHPTDKKRQ